MIFDESKKELFILKLLLLQHSSMADIDELINDAEKENYYDQDIPGF